MMVSPATLYRRLPRTPRRIRRLTVLGTFAGYPLLVLGYTGLVEPDRIPLAIWVPVAVVLMAMSVVGSFVVYGFVGDRLRSRDQLDERERTMSDRALIVSYGVVTTILVLALSALATATALGGPIVVGMEALTPVLIAAGLFVPLLPFAALAWIEPDAPADDDGR
jgi:hypothetical protein